MKKLFTLKAQFLIVVFMLLGCLSTQAADDNLITEQVVVKLDKAGVLVDKIPEADKLRITNLKVIGDINGTDLKMLRIMSGGDVDSEGNKGNLSTLDLSDAKIVAGGDAYYDNAVWRWDDGGKSGSITEEKYQFYTSDGILGKYSLAVCTKLKEVTLPSDITSIEEGTFSWCYDLEKVSIPSTVTSIGNSAFNSDTKLFSLQIPSSVTSIGDMAFYFCRGLTSLTIPSSITTIGRGAFYFCCGLTSLTIPSGVTSIGESVFSYCWGLTSLTISSGVTSIGYGAFFDCHGLTSLTIPSSVTSIDDFAFSGCYALNDIRYQINEDIGSYLEKGHPYISMGDKIRYFLNGQEITSVTIPSSVTKFGENAFQKWKDLTSVFVGWDIPLEIASWYDQDRIFGDINKIICTLYVPQGTMGLYCYAYGWNTFWNFAEYDPTGIDKVTTSNGAKEVSRYSVNGQRLSVPTKGLNIVKYSDGSVKKVVLK